jgi:Holliday junction resolvasome RuvABC endonuclease subunit
MERGFSRFNTATQQLYRVHGITNLCFKKTEQIYITPKTLKKAICGRGDVKKIYVIKKVKDMYPNLKITTNDEADALSLIYYHKTYVERM